VLSEHQAARACLVACLIMYRICAPISTPPIEGIFDRVRGIFGEPEAALTDEQDDEGLVRKPEIEKPYRDAKPSGCVSVERPGQFSPGASSSSTGLYARSGSNTKVGRNQSVALYCPPGQHDVKNLKEGEQDGEQGAMSDAQQYFTGPGDQGPEWIRRMETMSIDNVRAPVRSRQRKEVDTRSAEDASAISCGSSTDILVRRPASRLVKEKEPTLTRSSSSLEKYHFTDGGEHPGTVKLYIEANNLKGSVGMFRDAHVEFKERQFIVRVVDCSGRTWTLRSGLPGPVITEQCRFEMCKTGKDLCITLKKANAEDVWRKHQIWFLDEEHARKGHDLGKSFI